MNNVETAKILAVIAAVYSNFAVNDFKQKIWAELLADISYKDASIALKELLKTNKFPPVPSEIIEKANVAKILSCGGLDYKWLEGGDDFERIGDKKLTGADTRRLPENPHQ
nr:replicative helicase loader/inhibitor [Eubacterium sp. 1001713B170207_170306_E7]